LLEENISEKSAFVRLVLGIGLTACGISQLVKENGNRMLGTLTVTAGALKIAEGLFLYCPAKALFNRNLKDAVTTSIQEFVDGDSLMSAFNSRYSGANSQQSHHSGHSGTSNQQSQSQNSNGDEADLLQTVANVAGAVTSTTTAGTAAKQAANTIQAVAGSQNKSR